MMRGYKGLAAAALLASLLIMCGCQAPVEEQTADFSNYRYVAELATLECYYHNVAEINDEGTNIIIWKLGAKHGWFEYRGSVTMGIDASRVKLSEPDANNCVTVSIPPASVLGTAKVDENSFSDVYTDANFTNPINADDQKEAFNVAQQEMRAAAEADEDLKEQALEHAKSLLKEYVISVGKAVGEDYTVEFVMLDDEEPADGEHEEQASEPDSGQDAEGKEE